MPLSFALAVAVGAYLIGSLPSGYIVGRVNGVDLRKVGSGNIGATNALRVLGKKWGYLVFAADIFKGWLSVTLAYASSRQFAPDHVTLAGILAAVFAVLGHNFPVWLAFKGGKGIATSAGIMIALFPDLGFLVRSRSLGGLFPDYPLCFSGLNSCGNQSFCFEPCSRATWKM